VTGLRDFTPIHTEMASFWNAIERLEFDEAGQGQISLHSVEGGKIIELLRAKCGSEIKTIVEIGTWNGLGSTLCILNGMEGHESVKFWSLECNKEKHEAALESLEHILDDRTQLLWGSIVDREHIQSQAYLSHFPELQASEKLRHWFQVDLSNCMAAPHVLKDLPEKIDFLLLDGGEFTTLHEFSILFSRCVGYIALDDTKLDKCKEVHNRLTSLFEWGEIVSVNIRNGFSIFKRISL